MLLGLLFFSVTLGLCRGIVGYPDVHDTSKQRVINGKEISFSKRPYHVLFKPCNATRYCSTEKPGYENATQYSSK